MVVPVGMIVPVLLRMLPPIGRTIPVRIPRAIRAITLVGMVVTETVMRIIARVVVTVVRVLRAA